MAVPAVSDVPRTRSAASGWRRKLRWWLPAIVVLLLAAATLFLFALSSTKERSEAREKLVAETLWVRESIHFQLDREVEALQLIATDIARESLASAAIEARLQVYLRRAREVMAVAAVDGAMAPFARAERVGSGGDAIAQIPPALADSAATKAQRSDRPAFSAPFMAQSGAMIALFVPLGRNGSRGFLVSVHALDRLLDEMVPWTFAQEHEVTLSDLTDTLRARRISAGRGRGVYTHQEPLELGTVTLILGADSVKGPPDWIASALRGGISALSGILLFSLWALWRDHQRRIAAEQRLREEVAFRRSMGDSAVIGLRARDMNGRIMYVNPAFCRMVGYTEEEMVGGVPPMPYWIPERHEEYRKRVQEVLSGRASEAPFETVLRRRDGERFPAVIYDAPLRDGDGRQTGWMSSILDMSEEERAKERERQREERLATAARLTTMGEMASSLAHELNQPLAAIASYVTGALNLVERSGARHEDLKDALSKAAAQAQRAGQVIRRVHEFVRKQEPQRVLVEIGVLLDDCRALVELQARREGVRVSIEVEPGLPRVNGDPVMLQQVVLNLTRNAIEAMARAEPARRSLRIGAAREEEGLRVSVRDFGTGISDAVADRIFSAFYTTKPDGMGMGLSICRSIVEAHGGRLWFERHADGVEFHLLLPVAP